MAFGRLDRGIQPKPLSEINVTPLVDVMLVLLIIFIVTAPLLTHQIKLNLPKAETQASSVENPMAVSLTWNGQVYLDREFISVSELQARLEKMVESGASPAIELRVDGEIQYEQAVRLMALIQKAGVTKLSIVTDPGGDSSS